MNLVHPKTDNEKVSQAYYLAMKASGNTLEAVLKVEDGRTLLDGG